MKFIDYMPPRCESKSCDKQITVGDSHILQHKRSRSEKKSSPLLK